MLVANPIYDVVFKYLMKDKKVAKLLLSAIIGEEIIELGFRPTDRHVHIKDSLTVVRMDFSAKIQTATGAEKLIIIELQKAKLSSDIMRFRKYLGEQYANKNNVAGKTDKNRRAKALPIMSIYFLGHNLDHTDAPVIKVERNYIDLAKQEVIIEKEEFIESLTHDSFVIQIRRLSGRRRTELEQLLIVFDQDYKTEDDHLLNIKEEDLPKRYRPVLRRLLAAFSNKEVRDRMDDEDEIIEDFQNLERRIHEKDKAIEEKDKTIEEKDKALDEKDRLIEDLKNQLGKLNKD